ncbi:MAG: sigma-70 family RNA polymerase sigma factor [Planctomycetota bacterium]|jgi:RNA polymerase sigma-70 factor (ECF subfamily)
MADDRKERFETIAMPHLDSVYRVARVLAREDADAEDLTQEAFTRAYRAFDGFELREYGAKPWLIRILHNVFYSQAGRQRRQPTLLDDVDFDHFPDDYATSPDDALSVENFNWDWVDQELKAAVDELPAEYRTVLLLWAIEGLSYKEIAIACDCAIGTVMSRLYRARQLLGRSLRNYARDRKLSTERFES